MFKGIRMMLNAQATRSRYHPFFTEFSNGAHVCKHTRHWHRRRPTDHFMRDTTNPIDSVCPKQSCFNKENYKSAFMRQIQQYDWFFKECTQT